MSENKKPPFEPAYEDGEMCSGELWFLIPLKKSSPLYSKFAETLLPNHLQEYPEHEFLQEEGYVPAVACSMEGLLSGKPMELDAHMSSLDTSEEPFYLDTTITVTRDDLDLSEALGWHNEAEKWPLTSNIGELLHHWFSLSEQQISDLKSAYEAGFALGREMRESGMIDGRGFLIPRADALAALTHTHTPTEEP
jgi:hypothetical protein